MKLTRKELESQLALAKTLPADARKATLANLKAASVVDVDEKGVETPITVQIVESEPETKTTDADTIKQLVADEVAKHKAKQPDIGNKSETKFTIPAECKRYGQLKGFKAKSVLGSEYGPDERAFRFGMWAWGALGNPAAKEWCATHGLGLNQKTFSDELMQKLHSEGTNTAGGYLVPDEFGADLILLREQYGVARQLCNMVPMTSDTRSDPRQTGGLTGYFVAEGAAGTESNLTFDQVRLTVKDLMVLTRMTGQLQADSIINFADKLAADIAYAQALKEDQCMLIGDGTSTYGGIQGVRSKLGTKWSTGSVAGTITGVTKASSTTIASIAIADFENAIGSLPQYAAVRSPVWVCHSFFYYSTMLRLALAAGGNAQMEMQTGNTSPRPMFLGYPVVFSQVLGSTTAAVTVFALLGAFDLGVSFGDRQQNVIAFSTDASVGGESVFERNEIAVRGIERFDINVHDVGDGTTTGPIVGVATA